MILLYHLPIAPRLMPAPELVLDLLRRLGGRPLVLADGPLYGFATSLDRDLAHWELIRRYGLGAASRLGIVAERAV